MFAIVDIAGFQEKVQQGMTLKVPLQDAEKGAKLTFSNVLLTANDASVQIGAPYVSGASVETEILAHGRFPKIRVQKFTRRKRYRRVKGHRQDYTEIRVTKITG